VPRPGDNWRPILNLKPLNVYIDTVTFRMDTLQRIRPLLVGQRWAVSIDLKDAYFHIPVFPPHQHYLRFFYRKQAYQFMAMPFGLCTAPELFTRVAKEAAAVLRRVLGVEVFVYLDDWLIVHQDNVALAHLVPKILDLVINLGFIVNLEKSHLQPSRTPQYLGAVIDFPRQIIFPSLQRVEVCIRLATEMCECKCAPAALWQRLLGHLASFVNIVPFARLRMRPLQWHLRLHWSQLVEPQSKLVPVDPLVIPSLEWWTHQENLLAGFPFWNHHSIYTSLQLRRI
jgi:hypothetical protein